MDPETVPETLPIGESDSVPDSHEETEEREDTSTPDQPEEHSGECFGDAGLGKEEHFCCIPAVLSMDDLQVPGTQPWPAARRSRRDQCWCSCSLAHAGLFSMRTFMGSLLFPCAETPEPEELISEDNNPWAPEAHGEVIPSAEHKRCLLRCLFFCQGQLLGRKPKLLEIGTRARATS